MPEDLEDKPGTAGTAVADPPAADKKVADAPKETIESDLELTPTERIASRKAFMESHGYKYEPSKEEQDAEDAEGQAAKDKVKADEDKAAADAAAKDKDKKKDDEEKAKKAEAEDDDQRPKKKRKAAPAQAPIDYDELASKVAERTGQAQPPSASDQKTDKAADPDAGLSYAERKELKVLAKMSQLHPGVGDMAGKMKSFWNQERQYKTTWESQNPGVEFDDTDSVHDKFYQREPAYDQELYDNAQVALDDERIDERASKRAQEIIDKKVEPELQKRRSQEAFQKAEPEIQQASTQAMVAMLEKAVPELAKILPKGKNGQLTISQEAVQKMEEADPVAFEIVHDESRKLHAVVSELHKLDRLGEFYAPNRRLVINIGTAEEPERFYPHNELLNFIEAQEQAILASDKQVWDGKKFMPLGQLTALQDDILKKPISEQAKQAELDKLSSRFWSFETEDIVNMLVASHSRKVKIQLDRLEKLSAKRNGKATGATHDDTKGKVDETEEKPLPIVKKSNPPSSASATDTLSTEKIGKTNQQTQEEAVRQTWE